MKGNVFEIQKFALHDGPGIRTVIFLKGCPLNCMWCSNPESQLPGPQLSYDENKCTSCYTCIKTCPEQVFRSSGKKVDVAFSKCTACGKCVDVCGYNALKIYGYKAQAQELINEVIKDKKYFKNSGGGLTLSGGDPVAQIEFSAELLKLAKQEGIHTCVETSGYVGQDKLVQIVPFVDLFLFDYKLTKQENHLKYTGVGNEQILSNLDYLYKQGKDIVLRCPIIPGINNTIEHFKAIADLDKKYPNLNGIEIMAYHDWGSHKYKQIGKGEYPIKVNSVDEKEVQKWLNIFRDLGCNKIKKG